MFKMGLRPMPRRPRLAYRVGTTSGGGFGSALRAEMDGLSLALRATDADHFAGQTGQFTC